MKYMGEAQNHRIGFPFARSLNLSNMVYLVDVSIKPDFVSDSSVHITYVSYDFFVSLDASLKLIAAKASSELPRYTLCWIFYPTTRRGVNTRSSMGFSSVQALGRQPRIHGSGKLFEEGADSELNLDPAKVTRT